MGAVSGRRPPLSGRQGSGQGLVLSNLQEDREFAKREYDACRKIGALLAEMDFPTYEQALPAIIFLRYHEFDVEQPFLPQYDHNSGAAGGTCAACWERRTDRMEGKIYTRNEAALIVELFDGLLTGNGIKVPSPEDDTQREADNEAALYGSVYYGLLDEVEATLIDLLTRHAPDTEVVTDVFS